ncbi:MAG: redoxin family protein [Singulisphaera sp.]|nr:redoxin family protein [Singulisphaera sp.]
MCTLRPSLRLLILPLCLVGCASTTGVSSKVRTVATIGDKPLPVVTGEPGAIVASDRVAPEHRANPEGRISGRVVDAQGNSVANARVRLAVGNAPGGKVVRATTDRSGAFTLRGLRPGSSYTVIAEQDDGRGLLTGRAKAQAPETGVRIALQPADADSGSGKATASTSPLVNSVSSRVTREDKADEAEDVAPGVNTEDLPPAPEAEALAPTAPRRTASAASEDPPNRAAGWRRGEPDRPAPKRSRTAAVEDKEESPPEEPAPAPAPRDAAEAAPAASAEESSVQDDGPNPLPPALGSDQASSAPGPATPLEKGPVLAQAPPSALPLEEKRLPDPLAPPTALPEVAQAPPAALPEVAQPPPPKETVALAPAPPSGEVDPEPSTAPPAKAVTDEATAMTRMMQDDGSMKIAWHDDPVPSPEQVRPEPSSAPAIPAGLMATPEASAPLVPAPGPTETSAEGGTRRRPTWRELTRSSPMIPTEQEAESQVVTTAPDRPGEPPPRLDDGKAYCRYDSRHRRLEDFRLPDLQGRPVRFQDLDADLVLLDFWGTWCDPCVKSVPFLVDLQKRLGSARLKVVGIACEQGPPEMRAANAAQAVQRLRINYPVLVSGMDGPCPLQRALQIQAFPTMVLVDRHGRVLWRDQGATPVTLARLDRFLASAIRPDDAPRRY